LAAVQATIESKGSERYVAPYSVASVHALLGDTDAAIAWLEKAHAARDRAMIYLQVNPRFDRIAGDPRFRDLVRRMAYPPTAASEP
jgi:hypothetical protein